MLTQYTTIPNGTLMTTYTTGRLWSIHNKRLVHNCFLSLTHTVVTFHKKNGLLLYFMPHQKSLKSINIFRQHAASIYGFVRYITLRTFRTCVKKKIQATSKQGWRLRFGMLTILTNIRSTKVLHHASCIMHQASCTVGRKLRFGMLTALTNIRSTKVL